eukprot:12489737-Alexandrium_andersonii.AAC.1
MPLRHQAGQDPPDQVRRRPGWYRAAAGGRPRSQLAQEEAASGVAPGAPGGQVQAVRGVGEAPPAAAAPSRLLGGCLQGGQ